MNRPGPRPPGTERPRPGEREFEAAVIKVQRRPFRSFAVEVAAAEFATLEPGQTLWAPLGWFLVSSTRTGSTTVRFRGFGDVKLSVGDRVPVRAGRPTSRTGGARGRGE